MGPFCKAQTNLEKDEGKDTDAQSDSTLLRSYVISLCSLFKAWNKWLFSIAWKTSLTENLLLLNNPILDRSLRMKALRYTTLTNIRSYILTSQHWELLYTHRLTHSF